VGLSVDAAVDGGAPYAEPLGEFRDGVCACLVHLEEVSLLGAAELWLPAAEVTLRLGDLHSFARASSDEVGLELGDHREDVAQQPADGIVGVVNGAAMLSMTFFAVSSSTMSFASRRLLASRSSFAMTSVSPSRQEASASRRPGRDGRRRRLRGRRPLRTGQFRAKCATSTVFGGTFTANGQ
jgi:hypothetical protein